MSQGNGGVAGVAQWKKQLITKEDKFHVHKTIGLLCLLSYIFRLAQIGESDMGFAKYPALTVPTIALHLLLNLSALEFKIPHKRISSGYRIWPEYRLHSLVFCGRSLAVMGLYSFEETYNKEVNYDWNLTIIILGMLAADLCSWSQKDFRSRSIRDLDTPSWVKFLFSVAQFFGTANILFGLRRYSMHMLSVIIIQLNAFMMTVRRKNLASQNGLVAAYGFLLTFAMVVCTYEYCRVDEKIFLTVATIGQISVVQRMAPWPALFLKPISNKYVVWMFCGLGLRQARPYLADLSNTEMRLVYGTTFVLMWALGWYKSFGPGRNNDVVVKKVE